MTGQELLAIAKPILFNTEMVGAIPDNRKTVTRRVIKYKHSHDDSKTLDDFIGDANPQLLVGCCPYKLGDILYVRETWGSYKVYRGISYAFKADYIGDVENQNKAQNLCHGWRPSIHMPKEAARLFLRVTGVRVERLRDITEEQTIAEGADCHIPVQSEDGKRAWRLVSSRGKFISLWDSTIKKSDLPLYGWEASPWVWVIEFERMEVSE